MSPTIRFSHNYKKLNNERGAILLWVERIDLEKQSITFLNYDTEGIYILPKTGDYILLLFRGHEGTIFTTLRRYTRRKWTYYNELRNESFEIKVVE